MSAHATPTAWAQHLAQRPASHPAGVGACAAAPPPLLTTAEAQRVQRHRDQLMRALQARDRVALLTAKQQVLAAAFTPRDAHNAANEASATDSPALRRALRDLSWRMAGLLLPRSPTH